MWDELHAGLFFGSDRFVERLRPLLNDKLLDPEYRKCERFAARPSLQELFVDVTDKTTRNEQIYQAVRAHLMPWLRSTLAVSFHPVCCFPLRSLHLCESQMLFSRPFVSLTQDAKLAKDTYLVALFSPSINYLTRLLPFPFDQSTNQLAFHSLLITHHPLLFFDSRLPTVDCRLSFHPSLVTVIARQIGSSHSNQALSLARSFHSLKTLSSPRVIGFYSLCTPRSTLGIFCFQIRNSQFAIRYSSSPSHSTNQPINYLTCLCLSHSTTQLFSSALPFPFDQSTDFHSSLITNHRFSTPDS